MNYKDIDDNDTIKCEDCQKNWWGWAIRDNLGCCPDCKRPLNY